MGWIIFWALLTVVSYFLMGIICEKRDQEFAGGLLFMLLILAILTSGITYHMIAKRHSDGAPMAEIELGIYRVVQIYVAGNRVSVLIEKPESDGNDHLYLVQFSGADLASGIPRVAEKLSTWSRTRWLEVYKTSEYSGGTTVSKKYKLTE